MKLLNLLINFATLTSADQSSTTQNTYFNFPIHSIQHILIELNEINIWNDQTQRMREQKTALAVLS